MLEKIKEVLIAASERREIGSSKWNTIDLISDRKIPVDKARELSDFFERMSSELDINICVVGGGYGCTKITITAEASTKEEIQRLLEEIIGSDTFAAEGVKVGLDMIVRKEPYIHKTLDSGRILGQFINEGLPVFTSYSNEDHEYLAELEKHLSALVRQRLISTWYDRKMYGGDNWDVKIKEKLADAKMFLCLISADFLASDYCMNIELPYAIEREANDMALVVPIVVRPADWKETGLGVFQALPDGSKPVTLWENRDEAWTSVAKGIRKVIRECRQTSGNPAADKIA